MARTLHERGFSRTLALMAAAALAGLADSALAETTASLYLGASQTAKSDVRIIQPGTGSDATFHNVGWDSQSFSSPPYYGIRVDHFLDGRPEWGFGLDFTHNKVFAKTGDIVQVTGTWNGAAVNQAAAMNQRVQAFDISHGVNTLALNVYYRWTPEANGPFCDRCRPYLGAGPAYYVLHAENIVNGQFNAGGYKSAGFGYQLLAGLHYGITQTVGAFVEAKYNSGKVEVDIAGGRGETTLDSSQLLGGLSYTF